MSYRFLRERRRKLALTAAVAVLAAGGAIGVAQVASAAPDPGPAVKVNQVAYVPGLTKQATIVNSSTTPIAWTLRNSAGSTVASGQTTVRGADSLSGDNVHIADFSSLDTIGTGYVLSAGGANSFPFDISADPVKKLRYDSLAFFYHQRSGTPIDAQFVGSQYARPAGHVNVAPNQGDNNVPCRVPCGFTQDVRGGWYDAGDQGKYVVNGGISAWQLVNEYERAITVAGADPVALGDGKLAIPERSNGVPDILDEARWEIEFLLKMQVPDGRTDAGMARHKIGDQDWTGLPTRPEADPQPRVLSAVTTAATLNLAAVGAQAARVWRTIDPAFSSRALTAAQKAYAAAKANPSRFADANDSNGSGTYVDNTTNDEFYWAAAELYVTTGQAAYRTDVTGSSLYKGAGFNTGGFDWWWTAGLGDVTIALVPNGLPAADIAATRSAFTAYADRLLSQSATQGYPGATSSPGVYPWGSNGRLANSANILALAFDFTGQQKYRTGVYQSLDYLLGRNPLAQSYVAGYGDKATRNVHHRFWANQLNSSLPTAPPGALAGGPNTDLQDPVAAAQLAGCRPQKCYLDDIGAYSVNEVAINWNSALAWLSNWAAEKSGSTPAPDTTAPTTPGTPTASAITANTATLNWTGSTDNVGVAAYDVVRINGATETVVSSPTAALATTTGLAASTTYTFAVYARDAAGNRSTRSNVVNVTTSSGTPTASCAVAYSANTWSTGFSGTVTITNTSATAWTSWRLTFSLPGNQTLTQGWSAQWTQSANQVTAISEAWNATLAPGASVGIGFNATYSGTNTNPTTFTVNGSICG